MMRRKLSTHITRKLKLFTKNRCCLLLILCLVVYLLFFLCGKTLEKPHGTLKLTLPYVVVHIDMKGSPPKLGYLNTLLPMLKKHGVIGLLMEYEDMFPYEGKLVNLSAVNSYEKTELKKFLTTAVDNGFEIIPLVQTFGHMEFALKLSEFQYLREDAFFPDSICPTNNNSQMLIKEMLTQIIEFHNSIMRLKHIHVGCDEVQFINKCEQCYRRYQDEIAIFGNHVAVVAAIVENLSPQTTVLIWDDMLREIKPTKWMDIQVLPKVEPVYWDYKPDLSVSHFSLLQYHTKFDSIWIASAFKGADGDVATVPDIKARFQNHFTWMTSILGYKFGGERSPYNFKGIILTGWSRYSHMDPLCELLPVAVPSLILNLLTVETFKKNSCSKKDISNWNIFYIKNMKQKISQELKCIGPFELEEFDKTKCNYEGSIVYNKLQQCIAKNAEVAKVLNNNKTGIASKLYYSKLGSFNLIRLSENIMWCENTLKDIMNIENELHKAMTRFYRDDVISEYIESKTYYTKKILNSFLLNLNHFLTYRTWQRRPLKNYTISK